MYVRFSDGDLKSYRSVGAARHRPLRRYLNSVDSSGYHFAMKATIDIPDDLYQRVAAESARQGRPVDAVVTELIRRSLDKAPTESQGTESARVATRPPGMTRRAWAKQHPTPPWLDEWFRAAEEAFKDAPPGPTAREILEEDRNRLER